MPVLLRLRYKSRTCVHRNIRYRVRQGNHRASGFDGNGTDKKILTERIEEYHNAVIDRITINDDLGTEEENDYIALVYLTWNTKNSGKLSKEMLKMYSDDLAATLANENDTVQEIAIFWTVPYLNDTAKCSYERVPDGFVVMDEMWGNAFS